MPTQPSNFNPDDIRGIDVSHYQGVVNWQKVATSNIAFAYAKATDGIGVVDTHFAANYDGMKSNGILRGAYHFFRPALNAKAQADSFLHVVRQLQPGDLPPSLDLEVDGGKSASVIIKGAQVWIEEVEKALGRTPLIYTYTPFWNLKLGGTSAFAENPLWIAQYRSRPTPQLPKGFPGYAIWQFTSVGGAAVSGVNSKNLDLDRFNGTLEDLRKLAGL